MRRAGFVLAGGRSSRMGLDKALLPHRGATLLKNLAEVVYQAAGSVSLIGDPARYARLGYPVYADRIPGCGPCGGIATALSISPEAWNVIVACDMPGVTAKALSTLLEHAAGARGKCIVPIGPDGQPEPLCAVYHADCLPALERALREKRLKMKDLLPDLQPVLVSGLDPACFVNVNTPADWAEIQEDTR